MSDNEKTVETDEERRTAKRRKFLKSAAKVAVTTPAVTLMLAAGAKKTVQAGPYGYT